MSGHDELVRVTVLVDQHEETLKKNVGPRLGRLEKWQQRIIGAWLTIAALLTFVGFQVLAGYVKSAVSTRAGAETHERSRSP